MEATPRGRTGGRSSGGPGRSGSALLHVPELAGRILLVRTGNRKLLLLPQHPLHLLRRQPRQLGSRCLVLAPQHLNAGGAARAAVVAAIAGRLVDAVSERLYPFFEPYQSDGQRSESPPTV